MPYIGRFIWKVFWLSTSVRRITCTKLKNMFVEVGQNTLSCSVEVGSCQRAHIWTDMDTQTCTHSPQTRLLLFKVCVTAPSVEGECGHLSDFASCVCTVCVCVCLPPRPPVALRMFSDDWTGGLRELCMYVASGSAVLSLRSTLTTKGTNDEEWPTTVCTVCFCRLCVPPSMALCPDLWFAAMSELVGTDESVCSCVCIWYSVFVMWYFIRSTEKISGRNTRSVHIKCAYLYMHLAFGQSRLCVCTGLTLGDKNERSRWKVPTKTCACVWMCHDTGTQVCVYRWAASCWSWSALTSVTVREQNSDSAQPTHVTFAHKRIHESLTLLLHNHLHMQQILVFAVYN